MKSIHALLAAIVLTLGVTPVFAQTSWPERPVRLIVGFTPGSATDVTARLFAQRFTEAWGQPVTVENISGASGSIAVDRVAKAPADGYMLMWTGNAAVTVMPAMQTMPFDPVKDFTPISITLAMPSVFAVNNDFPVKSIADLVARAKAEPGKISFGSPGIGTPQHIAGEMFAFQAGIKMVHVPYRGAVMTDTLGGIVPVAIQNAGAMLPLVRDGRLRGIGVTSLKRSPNAPDLPTFAESGFPGFEATSWFALLAPAGTSQAIVEKVRAEALKVLADPEMIKRFAVLGLEPVGSTAAEVTATIARDIPKWAKVIKDADIKPGN